MTQRFLKMVEFNPLLLTLTNPNAQHSMQPPHESTPSVTT